MLHEKKTLHEDLKQMGLGMDGEVRNGGGDVSINESVMDDIRKAIDKKVADVKILLASLTLKKVEAERALQIVKERFASLNVCDVIDDASCPVRAKAEGLGEDKKVTGPVCDVCGKKAVVNYQKVWVEYPVDSKGGYGKPSILDDQDPSGEENLHYCKDHDEENRPV